MHAPTEQIRSATADAVDAARHQIEWVAEKAPLVAASVAEKAPLVAATVAERPRRHRLRTVLLAAAVLAVIFAIAKKLTAESSASPTAADAPTTSPAPTITSDEETEPVASGSA